MFKKIFNKKDMIELQDILRNNKKTITTAESCTGGLVASMITKVSGSSDIFNGSIVSYSNKIKNQELNVNNETLEKFGAVSTEVVNEMLDGAIKKFEADFAIAISGIAGPTGATKNKPVGTVVIGISDANNVKIIDTF
ncbi:CinA family protein, partial [Aliarcobacter butzleri]